MLAATAAITACTTTADGTPHPKPGVSPSEIPSSTPTTSEENQEAPRVEAPLDATTFLNAPCTTLTPSQLSSFAVDPPGVTRDLEGVPQGCSWHGVDGSISIDWLRQNKGGLSDTYRGGEELNAYFVETTVAGYPAVFADAIDARANGSCSLIVGVSDTLTFLAGVDNSKLNADTSCAVTTQVATAAIATIKEAN